MEEQGNPGLARWVAAIVVVLGAGCVATPVPEPPNLEPPVVERVQATFDRQVGTVLMSGGSGAAEPGALLWVVNLDSLLPPLSWTVAGDGSFELVVPAEPGDELRLQVRHDELRSEPVDAILGSDGALSRSARQACVVLAPRFELELGSVAVGEQVTALVEVLDDCPGALSVVEARLRVEPSPFEVAAAAPFDLGSGETADLEVTFSPPSAGPHEEILFLELGSPSEERRPVTVLGRGSEE